MSIIEIGQDNRHLSVERGFLVIQDNDSDIARIPYDTIDAIIVTAFHLTYSNHLLKTLCEKNIPLIICGENFHPSGILLGSFGHYRQAEIILQQTNASKPLIKKIWRTIIKAKITNQAHLLKHAGKKFNDLLELEKNIPSGDSNNTEGVAAQRYWPRLLGNDFRRNTNDPGLNVCLNYGYSILRAAMARAIVTSGLHPAIGIHHCNQTNPFQLVDDLMEPFRPFIDNAIKNIATPDIKLTPDIKRTLVMVLNNPVNLANKTYTLQNAMQEVVRSFASSLAQGKDLLISPLIISIRISADDVNY